MSYLARLIDSSCRPVRTLRQAATILPADGNTGTTSQSVSNRRRSEPESVWPKERVDEITAVHVDVAENLHSLSKPQPSQEYQKSERPGSLPGRTLHPQLNEESREVLSNDRFIPKTSVPATSQSQEFRGEDSAAGVKALEAFLQSSGPKREIIAIKVPENGIDSNQNSERPRHEKMDVDSHKVVSSPKAVSMPSTISAKAPSPKPLPGTAPLSPAALRPPTQRARSYSNTETKSAEPNLPPPRPVQRLIFKAPPGLGPHEMVERYYLGRF